MVKNKIRITESKLQQIVAESVKKVLNESIVNDIDERKNRAVQLMEEMNELEELAYGLEGNAAVNVQSKISEIRFNLAYYLGLQ